MSIFQKRKLGFGEVKAPVHHNVVMATMVTAIASFDIVFTQGQVLSQVLFCINAFNQCIQSS